MLKLLVSRLDLKVKNGQINHLNILITQKTGENEVHNRGSKSIIILMVKEQRANGNYLGTAYGFKFKCALMGFERSYQIKILSKQIIKLRTYSSIASQKLKRVSPQKQNLDP